jgi:hypothetical protein
MLEDITKYSKNLKSVIEENSEKAYLVELREFLFRQIQFLQHERLIHLLVTLSVALFTLITLFTAMITEFIYLYLVVIILITLLIPYLFHYMKLENGVQNLYLLYEKLNDKVQASKPK